MLRRPAAFRRTRAAAARPTATTPERLTSRFHGRSSKAARIYARRITADATGRQRDTQSRSILPPVILAFDASGEKPLMHHKQESVVMLSSILPDKWPFLATPPRKTRGLRSCASLLGATMLMSLSGPGTTPATAQQPPQKPNILFIMGDDIGWMQPGIYHRGLMVGETPNLH